MRETTTSTCDETLLDALRCNLRLLHELTMRYGVETQPPRAEDQRPTILGPADVRQLVAPEMAGLAQEQVRVLLLDSRHHVVSQRVIYQGNVGSAVIRPARGFAACGGRGHSPPHHLPQPPQRRSDAECGRHRAGSRLGRGGQPARNPSA